MKRNDDDFSSSNDFNGYFIFGLKVLGKVNNEFEVDVQIRGENIPKDLIIMKMKAQLRQFERDYFKEFDDSTNSAEFKGA